MMDATMFSDLPQVYWDYVAWGEPAYSPIWQMMLEEADAAWWALKSRLVALFFETQKELAA